MTLSPFSPSPSLLPSLCHFKIFIEDRITPVKCTPVPISWLVSTHLPTLALLYRRGMALGGPSLPWGTVRASDGREKRRHFPQSDHWSPSLLQEASSTDTQAVNPKQAQWGTCTHTKTYTHPLTHTETHIPILTHTHTHSYLYNHTLVLKHTSIHSHFPCTHPHTYTHTHMLTYTHTFTLTYTHTLTHSRIHKQQEVGGTCWEEGF